MPSRKFTEILIKEKTEEIAFINRKIDHCMKVENFESDTERHEKYVPLERKRKKEEKNRQKLVDSLKSTVAPT